MIEKIKLKQIEFSGSHQKMIKLPLTKEQIQKRIVTKNKLIKSFKESEIRLKIDQARKLGLLPKKPIGMKYAIV